MLNNIIDFVSAIAILISLIFVKDNPEFWGLYSAGCLGYTILGSRNKMYGLMFVNTIAMLIGISNLLS